MSTQVDAFSLDQAGLEQAENFWAAQHSKGIDYKFGVTKNKQLVAVPPGSELYNSAKAYKTPREAEQAVVGRQPTRTLMGAVAGSAVAPKGQYSVTNPLARDAEGNLYPSGRAGDPVRKEQTNAAADFAQDIGGDVAHYGPSAGMSIIKGMRSLPKRVLGPGATAVSIAGDLVNTVINAQRGDALYSSPIPQAALTGAAAGTSVILQKHFSKPEQVKRELDDLIRKKMGIGSKGKVDPEVRSEIIRRGEAGLPMYTWDDWHNAPTRRFEADVPRTTPLEYQAQPLVFERPGKPMSRKANPNMITNDITEAWLKSIGIEPQSVNIDEMTRVLRNTYLNPKSNLGMAMFPKKGNPVLTYGDWIKHKANTKSTEEGMMWDRAAKFEDPTIQGRWEKAKKDQGERKSKINIINKSEGNVGKGGDSKTPIVSQDEYSKLGSTGKWIRRGARTGAFMLPMAAEVFGKYLLPTGGKKNER